MNTFLDQFFFGYYPYVAMTMFIVGSALRYDRDQYTWKADSSQLLRKKACCGVVIYSILE